TIVPRSLAGIFCRSSTSAHLCYSSYSVSFFFFNATATTAIYTLSLQTLFRSMSRTTSTTSCWTRRTSTCSVAPTPTRSSSCPGRSEEHTSELQSRENLVCRLLLEKKKIDDSIHSDLRQ